MVGVVERDEQRQRLTDLDLDTLVVRCRDEITRYRRGESGDDRYAMELFQRAIEEQDDRSWQALHAIFHGQVRSWCRIAAHDRADDVEDLACATWARFWQSFTPDKLRSATCCAGVLRYLKMCTWSAAADEARSRRGCLSLDESPIEQVDTAPVLDESSAARDASGRFWAIVNANLKDDRERLLAYMAYELGLKSAEIQAQRPDLFASVTVVYQVARNLLDRLRRDRELQRWFERGGC
jgi:hypothetical protein